MTYYKQINIVIENRSNYNINFAYNNDTTFDDLLGFISYNNPENKICPCFKIQYCNNSNNIYYDLPMYEKVYNYINGQGFTKYKLIKRKKRRRCNCFENFNKFLTLSKNVIINTLIKYANNFQNKIQNLQKSIDNDYSKKNDKLFFISNNFDNDYPSEESDEENEDNFLPIDDIEENKKKEEEKEEEKKEEKKVEVKNNLKKDFINYLNSNFGNGFNILIRKINKLKEEKLVLLKEINRDIDIDNIERLSELGITGNLLPRLNLIRLDPMTNQYIGNETSIKKDFTEFYDIIVDIKSIKDISKGWEIKKSKRAETNYEQFKKDKVIKIGVIGNSNKGKSFLLSKISKVKDLPSGTSIRTEGLSVKYPELDTYKDRKIVLLDSAGLETPVLNNVIIDNNIINEKNKENKITEENNKNKENKNEKNKKNEENYENEENEENESGENEWNEEIEKNEKNEGIKNEANKKNYENNKEDNSIEKITKGKENSKESNNSIEEKNDANDKKTEISEIENLNNQFQENSREKLITELFLQNYIINNSDILIIVVGILTYSEQKLLYKIKNEILKMKKNRPLFIIHNLITYTTIDQVEDYIKNYLLKSATFTLESGHKISTKRTTKSGVYYYEKNVDANIYHLIFANEGSEAGEYYNNLTLDFLENSYQNVINLKSFDIIQTVKERFVEVSNEILEKTEKPLTLKDFDNSNDKYIKLTNQKITLKKCLINELGISNLITNGFEPTYNVYQKDNKIILRIEASGNSRITYANKDYDRGDYIHLIVKGNKKKDKEPSNLDDNIFNKRKYGDFFLDIPINREYILKNEMPKVTEKKGIICVEYNLEDKSKGGELLINEEDEI